MDLKVAEETTEEEEEETTIYIIVACVGGVIFLIITGACGYYCKRRSNEHIKVINDGHETVNPTD